MMRMLFAALLLCVFGFPKILVAQSTDPRTDAYIESLRADFRADKVDIITEAMRFSDQDGKVFWPVYKKYEAELTTVNDQRVALIKAYSDKFTTMSDADAKTLIEQGLDFESRRTEVKKKYAQEFQKSGLSALTIAKFLQLEHRLDLLVDMKIASELPSLLIKPTGQSSPKQ